MMNLPYGAIVMVAKQLNVSPSLVSKVARGERKNFRIEVALLEQAAAHAARMKRIARIKARMRKAEETTPKTTQEK